MNKHIFTRSVIFLAIVSLSFSPAVASASFNRHRVISDGDLTDYTRMSATAIQSFLNSQTGILDTYRSTDIDGVERSAAEIIYNASYRYRINPQFVLARIQTESSLISGSRADLLPWLMGYGVCDSCSKDDPNVIKYKGFAKQINAALDKVRNSYLAQLEAGGTTVSGWKVGVAKNTLDGLTIVPQNNATAVLYTYTPWLGYHGGDANVGGNSLFYDIMERYFPGRTSEKLEYPDSTLFQNIYTGAVYKLEDGKIRPIISSTALLANYDPSRIIPVDDVVLNRYPEGDVIAVPKYMLLQDSRGGIYLIDNRHKRRAITSREIFYSLGYNPEEVIPVSDAELSTIPEGAPLTTVDKYPLGALVQSKTTGAVMYLDQGDTLHPVWDRSIMDSRFKGYIVNSESQSLFDSLKEGKPVKFADGTLVKISYRDTVYVIDNGMKRPVVSMEVLNRLGGFENVVETTKSVLQLHETGDPLDVEKAKSKDKKKETKKKSDTTKKKDTKAKAKDTKATNSKK